MPGFLGIAEPEFLNGYAVPATLFEMLGTQPALGRTFLAEEDLPGAPAVVILDYLVWQQKFGGDPAVIGHPVALGNELHTVIGVMPTDFGYPITEGAQYWVPLNRDPQTVTSVYPLQVYGRVRSNVPVEQAIAELNSICHELAGQVAEVPEGRVATLTPLHDVVAGVAGRLPFVLLAAVGFVLLITLVNVSNLMLGHISGRSKEIGVRLSVGAKRVTIIRQMLTESLLLSGTGALMGIGLTWVALPYFVTLLPGNIPRTDEIAVDFRVALFGLLVCVISAGLFAVYPAYAASRQDLLQSMKSEGRVRLTRNMRGMLRNTLTVAEVALAIVLCIGAGLLLKSFNALLSVDIGIDPVNVVVLEVPPLTTTAIQDAVGRYRRFAGALMAVPGVTDVSFSSEVPLVPANNFVSRLRVDSSPEPGEEYSVEKWVVTPGYFNAIGLKLIRGRFFSDLDNASGQQVMVVSESAAATLWRGEDPIGKSVSEGTGDRSRTYTVVGVVKDVTKGRFRRATSYPAVYWSLMGDRAIALSHFLLVRFSHPPDSIIPSLREAVWSVDANQPIRGMELYANVVARERAEPRFRTVVLGLFATIAWGIALIGLYGVVTYLVAKRTNELGIRIALGARRSDIFRLVMAKVLMLVSLGIFLGVLGSIVLSRFIGSFLPGTEVIDGPTYLSIAAIFFVVAVIACWAPARRATVVDPMAALRFD